MSLTILAAGIGEKRNVAADEPAVVARLEAARQAWDRELVQPLFQNPRVARKKGAP